MQVERQTQQLQQQQQDSRLNTDIEELSQQRHHLETELQQLTAVLTESRQAHVVAGAQVAAAATRAASDLQATQVTAVDWQLI